MKKLFISVIMMLALGVNNSNLFAQSYVREGNNIRMVSSNRAKKDTLITEDTLEDSKGVKRTIVINKDNGHCYTCRFKEKDGKFYRSYFPEPLWGEEKRLAAKYNIPYVEHKKRK